MNELGTGGVSRMEIPANYEKLGRAGYVNRQNYSATATYNRMDTVYYQGSTYVALADNLTGVSPDDSGSSWMYLARGFSNVEQPFKSKGIFIKNVSINEPSGTYTDIRIRLSILKQAYIDISGLLFYRTSNDSDYPVTFRFKTGGSQEIIAAGISSSKLQLNPVESDANAFDIPVTNYTEMTFLYWSNERNSPDAFNAQAIIT